MSETARASHKNPLQNHNLLNKLRRFEALYEKDGSLKNAWGLALRCYQHYRLTGEGASLQRAHHLLTGISTEHVHYLPAYFLLAYLELEMGQYARVGQLLDNMKPFKNNIRSSPRDNAMYTFLQAALELRRGKARSAKRRVNALETINNNLDDPFIDVLLGSFAVLMYESETALEYFVYAHKKLPDSAVLFLFLRDLFIRDGWVDTSGKDAPLMRPFLRWAGGMGVNASGYLENRQSAVMAEITGDPAFGRRLYKDNPSTWLLKGLCACMIENHDYSKEAYDRYKEAEARQLDVPGLPEALVASALKNKAENVSSYTINQFLRNRTEDEDMDLSLFVYYLALSREGMEETLKRHGRELLRLCLRAIEINAGREWFFMPSLCAYILQGIDLRDKRYAKYLKKADNYVRQALFTHELTVTSGEPRYAWVVEKEKSRSRIYEIDGGKSVITAASADFTYFLFDDSMKNMPEAEAYVTPRMAGAGPGLLKRLYNEGLRDPEMLIALSAYYIGLDALPEEGAALLAEASAMKELSEAFRARISAELGNYYAEGNDFVSAVAHYESANENYLDARGIEKKLLAYVNAGRLQEAAVLVQKKAHAVSDKALFYSLKKIAAARKYNEIIATAAYELTFRNWYDKQLVAIALEHAQAGSAEWQEFSRALHAVNAQSESLDENILNNAVWMHRFDAGAQKVFTRLTRFNPDNPYIAAFALYAAYEMIINAAKPEYETLVALERLALSSNEGEEDARFLYYGLCHVYGNHGITTFNSEEITRKGLGFCEQDGFIFPVLKEGKDKTLLTPYIEKNQPFIYKGGKGKRVKLFYRAEGDKGEYAQKTMRYVRFGLYAANVPVFFEEKLNYYFSEEMPTGSVITKEAAVQNTQIRLVENSSDLYYIINNAIIYESMFKYEAVEEIITERLKETPRIKGWLM